MNDPADLLSPELRARAAAIRDHRADVNRGPQYSVLHRGVHRPALRAGDVSSAEARALELVADGLSNLEAATRLHLSEETVKSHLRHASARNGARNRTHLAVMFATGRLRVVDTRHR